MRHVIRALGSSDLIEVGPDEYADMRSVKNALVTMIGVEQKFDFLFENYADYERELLELSLRRALYQENEWRGFQDDISSVSRRLANLLSACRLYLDQVRHDLRTTFGPPSDLPDKVEKKTNEEYDA